VPPEAPHSQYEHELGSLGQSAPQLHESSPASQTPFPQTAPQPPQSPGQELQSSPPPQMPLPHVGPQTPHAPHASAQQLPYSGQFASHWQFPPVPPHSQYEHEFGSSGQSAGQVHESSPASQLPFGHPPQAPQSPGHELQPSPQLQAPSPQTEPQSLGQVPQFS